MSPRLVHRRDLSPVDIPQPALTPRQRQWLLLLAQDYTASVTATCDAIHVSQESVALWRRSNSFFAQAERTIRSGPRGAANFILIESQPGAAQAWVDNLKRGGRYAYDAAIGIMRESRERKEATGSSKLRDAFDRAANSPEPPQIEGLAPPPAPS